MITEIVFIELPKGSKRADALAIYRKTADKWRTNPGLIEKYYFFDVERCLGGGVDVWPDRAAARRWRTARTTNKWSSRCTARRRAFKFSMR
jgi:hypothetical protein